MSNILHIFLFFSPNMANTVNAALKPLETLSRIVNQPSSLFGSKGSSSKNKTEHDTVGTTRDTNSNTQDQGTKTCQIHFNSWGPQIPVMFYCWVCNIYLRGVWWDRASGGQPQGAGNRQWSHGWRDRGRHSGHCWPARGSQHTSYAGDQCYQSFWKKDLWWTSINNFLYICFVVCRLRMNWWIWLMSYWREMRELWTAQL